MIGDYNRSEFIVADTNQSLTITAATPNVWIFNLNMSFGLINMTNPDAITEYYTPFTNDTYYQALI